MKDPYVCIHTSCVRSPEEKLAYGVSSIYGEVWQGGQELTPSTVPAAFAGSEARKHAENLVSCLCLWLTLGSVFSIQLFFKVM